MPTGPFTQAHRRPEPCAPGVRGSGVVRQRVIVAPCTSRIVVASCYRAELFVDPRHVGSLELHVRADDNLLELARAESRDGALHVDLQPCSPVELSELSLTATVGPLSDIIACGAADVLVRNLRGSSLALSSRGGSRVRASGAAEQWRLTSAGSSRLQLLMTSPARDVFVDAHEASQQHIEGAVHSLSVQIRGTAAVRAEALRSAHARVCASGVSRASVYAEQQVDGQVRAGASLRVAGSGRVAVAGRYRRS